MTAWDISGAVGSGITTVACLTGLWRTKLETFEMTFNLTVGLIASAAAFAFCLSRLMGARM